jgi:predicted SAM-dependent methyltransferase
MSDPAQPVRLNVGSSTVVVEGFVNFDNSPFLWLADVAPWAATLLPRKYRDAVDEFEAAKARATMRRRDCRRPLPYQAGEVDHILSSHFLEFLPPPAMQRVLADFHRVLRPNGTAHIVLPDVSRMARRYVQGEIDADEFQRELMLHPEQGESLKVRLLEVGSFRFNHRWMYDRVTAAHRMELAGFAVIDDAETPSSWFRADDDASLHLVGTKPAQVGSPGPA